MTVTCPHQGCLDYHLHYTTETGHVGYYRKARDEENRASLYQESILIKQLFVSFELTVVCAEESHFNDMGIVYH